MIKQARKGKPDELVILLLDALTTKIINCVFSLDELTDYGVGVIQNVAADGRESMSMDAIYFIEPSPNSVLPLINDYKDPKNPTYNYCHVFFTSRVSFLYALFLFYSSFFV
jgi:hypothetical protein